MRVMVIGGYGEFGSRLSQLLVRDRHDVLVAGRSLEKANLHCQHHGGTPCVFDITRDARRLNEFRPDAVVDTVGPFQAYGDTPWALAEACISRGIHYIDIADDGEFIEGISALNESAIANNCFAISGASSTPAISCAAVEKLTTGLGSSNSRLSINLIETAIVPGSRAPRGLSVIHAVLSQAGEPFKVWRGGRWTEACGWIGSKPITLTSSITRTANLFGAADVILLPKHFNARSVIFRAGLELPIMHRGLELLARLRKSGLTPPLTRFVRLLRFGATALESRGTDIGGMVVGVTLPGDNSIDIEHRWTLVAGPGNGPFIPVTPVRAILRHPALSQPGARPCMSERSLQDYISAMDDLDVTCTESTSPVTSLYRAAVGEDLWQTLSPAHRLTHRVIDIERFSGRASVTRGTSLLARAAAIVFRFPATATDIPITVTKSRGYPGEIWERNFDGRQFRSRMTPASAPGHVREHFGLLVIELGVEIRNGEMHLPVTRGWFAGIPLPRALLPASISREYVDDGCFYFDVKLLTPLTGQLGVHYRGWLEAELDMDD